MPTGRRATMSGRSEYASPCARFTNSRRVSCSFVTGSTNRIASGARARASDSLPKRFVLVLTEDTRSFTTVASVAAAKFYIQSGFARNRFEPDSAANPTPRRWRSKQIDRPTAVGGEPLLVAATCLISVSSDGQLSRIADVRISTTAVRGEAGARRCERYTGTRPKAACHAELSSGLKAAVQRFT